MKKFLLMLVVTCLSATLFAQPAVGTFSVIPRVGISITNLPGDKIYTAQEQVGLSPRNKAGFMGGVDFDYQFMRNLSVMVGAQYVQQGCRYDNEMKESDNTVNTIIGRGYNNMSTQLHYLNVPIMLNAYIGPGFAFKAGVQIGFALSGKMKYREMSYVKDKDGTITTQKPVDTTIDYKSTLTKVNVSIPLGLSYEFANVIIDARYNIGLTKFQNIKNFDSSKNKVITLSAAYRFAL